MRYIIVKHGNTFHVAKQGLGVYKPYTIIASTRSEASATELFTALMHYADFNHLEDRNRSSNTSE